MHIHTFSYVSGTTTTTPWPFWLKIAHAQIENCISLMVKSLGKFLSGETEALHQRQWWSTSLQHQWFRQK